MSLQSTAWGVVMVIAVMFIGLFLINQVATVTAINNTSSFYTMYTQLITNSGTIYSVLGIGIVIFILLWVMGFFGSREGGM